MLGVYVVQVRRILLAELLMIHLQVLPGALRAHMRVATAPFTLPQAPPIFFLLLPFPPLQQIVVWNGMKSLSFFFSSSPLFC